MTPHNRKARAIRAAMQLVLLLAASSRGRTAHQLAEELRVSLATVKRYLVELETLQPINRTREGRGRMRYRITLNNNTTTKGGPLRAVPGIQPTKGKQ